MSNTQFVRVTAENGNHVSVPAGFAESRGLTPLKEDATDRYGRPYPEAPATAAAKKAAEKVAKAAESNPSGSTPAASNKKETQ